MDTVPISHLYQIYLYHNLPKYVLVKILYIVEFRRGLSLPMPIAFKHFRHTFFVPGSQNDWRHAEPTSDGAPLRRNGAGYGHSDCTRRRLTRGCYVQPLCAAGEWALRLSRTHRKQQHALSSSSMCLSKRTCGRPMRKRLLLSRDPHSERSRVCSVYG